MFYNFTNKALSLGDSAQNWIPSHKPGTINGTSYNDVFYAVAGDTMSGGAGDDQYHVWSDAFAITEKASAGTDTLYYYGWSPITLPKNVENLVLGGNGAIIGIGNDQDNIIQAGTAGAFITGGKGDDILIGGHGMDTFSIVAGQGSEVIYDFVIGQDQVRLDGYRLGGFDGLMSHATQVGSDVLLSLSSTESMIIRNVALSDLSANDFLLRSDPGVLAAESTPDPIDWATKTLAGKDTGMSTNGWYAITNGWNTGNLKYGTDFTESVSFNAKDLSVGTTFNWTFPTKTLTPGVAGNVLAYPDLLFGASPFSGGTNPGDKAQVFPVQISALTSLKTSFDVAFSGDTKGFNVAYDIWLTNVPGGGPSTVTNEIMIWLHQGDFEAFGSKIGTYQDGDFSATIYRAPGTNYTAIVANEDVAVGTIDMLKLFNTLADMGIVDKNDYLAASQLGAEVVSGSGSLTINNMAYDVQTQNADGTYTQQHVTGAGTTTSVIDPITTIEGTDTADHLTGGSFHHAELWGHGGDDILTAGTGANTLYGGTGNDTYILHSATDQVVEYANEGHDTVKAGFSYTLTDHVEDLILTGTGNITATGNALNNHIFGNSGDNHIYGGSGDDILDGGAGADSFFGGEGFDYVSYQSATSGISLDLWMGPGTGDARGDSFDSIEGIIGSEYADSIMGANTTNDVINGAGGDDKLYGRGGDDILDGGAGNDTLTGGWGKDTFVFSKGGGRDTIADFNYMGQQDMVQLDKALGVTSYADIVSHLKQVGNNAVLTFDTGDSLLFYNVKASQLHATDFVFV